MWLMPNRVICITSQNLEAVRRNVEFIAFDLWAGLGSSFVMKTQESPDIGVNHISRAGQLGSISVLDFKFKSLSSEDSKVECKNSLIESLKVFKPSLVLIQTVGEFAHLAIRSAIDLDIPVVFEQSEEFEVPDFLIRNSRLSSRASYFKRQDNSDCLGLSEAVGRLIKTDIKPTSSFEELKINKLRIATIMDEFTYASYSPEADLLQLTPSNVLKELQDFKPELLFIESAWNGRDELWDRKIGNPSEELRSAISWCKEQYIPTVFWNKEDPVHFETFLSTASLFDYVFTTDIDCISQYKAYLGHERVYLLPFGCQPTTHNPVELYDRKDAFSFAGAYYVRYPDRTKDLESFVDHIPKFKPLEIFDRNFGKDDINYQFPEKYKPFIVGTLPFKDIDKAYKGYKFAINLNSIKQSQTMFARRLFDLLGCNTATLSNFSQGVRLLFGDLVVCTDQGETASNLCTKLSQDLRYFEKYRLAGLRKVMIEHTYAHRLAYVAAKAFKKPYIQDNLPKVHVVARAHSLEEFTDLVDHFERQTHQNKRMLLVLAQKLSPDRFPKKLGDGKIQIIQASEASKLMIKSKLAVNDWLACMSANDYYGANYLTDLAIATKYSGALAIGKASYFKIDRNNVQLINEGTSFKPSSELVFRSSMIEHSRVASISLEKYLDQVEKESLSIKDGFAIDPYNYCYGAYSQSLRKIAVPMVDDIEIFTGVPMSEIIAKAEAIAPQEEEETSGQAMNGEALVKHYGQFTSKNVKSELVLGLWRITSTLEAGKHEYVYAKTHLSASYFPKAEVKWFLDMSPGLNAQLVFRYLDKDKKNIGHEIKTPNKNHVFNIPAACKTVEMGLRVYESGQADVKSLMWGHRKLEPAVILGQHHLVVTDQYPSYENLYRNGFVHTRVKAYKSRGVSTDVFCLRKDEVVNFREFENINVTTGSNAVLDKLLESGRYSSVFVHFLSPDMWNSIEKYIDKVNVRVWVHGSEIHPWHRRMYNYQNDEQIEKAKLESEERMKFWHRILKPMHKNLKLIFVSKYFSEEVMEDLGFRLPQNQYHVIHNPINTELFSYKPKREDQRFKILSIRPFASRQYANDITIKAILELSKSKRFKDLEIRIIGDGILFEETVEPLKDFKNVMIEKRFVTHEEISKLHKDYGIFLCPTRWDSQGVSRDEAMASGLVPITTDVAAVSEFVSDGTGFMSAPEDYLEISKHILELVENSRKFLSMSERASKNVMSNRDLSLITDMELKLGSL